MALGPEKVLNGDFALGTSPIGFDDWLPGAGWSVISEEAVYSGGAYGNTLVQVLGGIISGNQYSFNSDMLAGSVRVKIGEGGYTNYPGGDLILIADTTGDLAMQPLVTDVTLDNVSVKEVLPDTTTVEVEWIDSISAAATGNKIYRDDVEIADIGMGIQFYSDATAETGTTYKYEVQAYSATEETTQEVTGVNVQTITTA